MTEHCFTVLIDHLNGNAKSSQKRFEPDTLVDGLFVTWTNGPKERLRGCIGSLSALPLSRLSEFAITSSQRDSRFLPIALPELPQLTCSVSILHSFEKCMHYKDWTVGVHGIVVEFTVNKRTFKATFLPHVIPDQCWDQETAIESACKKSGFHGNTTSIVSTIVVTRYQCSKSVLTHQEYVERQLQ